MKLFYNSEEVANHLNVPLSTLNYYLKAFRLNINKVGKNRKFSHADLDKLQKITHLIEKEGFTIEGAKEKLKNKKNSIDDKAEVIEKLKSIKTTLEFLQTIIK